MIKIESGNCYNANHKGIHHAIRDSKWLELFYVLIPVQEFPPMITFIPIEIERTELLHQITTHGHMLQVTFGDSKVYLEPRDDDDPKTS